METTEKTRPRRPVEVRQARAGAARILRRGLHGAKDWALEPDADGLPRSPLAKTARVLVLLTPLWIVLSAATGGPERGQQQASVPQALLLALLVTLAGLGWLSAWERRRGNEEPWAETAEEVTDGDIPAAGGPAEPTGEEPTRVLEEPQVREVCNTEEGCNAVDIPPNGGGAEQTARISLRKTDDQATTEGAESPVRPAQSEFRNTAGETLRQATSEGVNREKSDSPQHPAAPPQHSTPTQVLPTPRNTFPEPGKPQVSPETAGPGGGGGRPGGTPLAESDATPQQSTSPAPLRQPLREEPAPPDPPQVRAGVAVLQEPLRGALSEDWAARGPHPADPDPVAEDWWLVTPDVAPGPVAEEAAPETPEPPPNAEEEPDVTEEEIGETDLAALPRPVQEYLLTRSPTALPQERKVARDQVTRWARREVREGGLSQAEIARLARVQRSTVNRWISEEDDPWMA